MTLLSDAPPAVRPPRFEVVPEFVSNDADDAAFLGDAYGLPLDEWQVRVLRAWLGSSENGRWAATRCGLSVPRQNGKNGVLEIRELYGMVVLGERFLHSAHEVKTSAKAFKRLQWFFGEKAQDIHARFPDLNALVKEVRRTNGQEAIVLKNGGSVEFVTRTKSLGRGFSVDVLVIDEAQEANEEQLASAGPTISASRNPQRIYLGSPPGPASPGEVFTRLRGAALSGNVDRLAWQEWSADKGDDLDDRELWAKANPALGVRISAETIEDERADMSDETFARERLGMWEAATSSSVIDEEAWEKLYAAGSTPVSRVVFGIDVNPERTRASISLAGYRGDGVVHCEQAENARGVDWVVPLAKRLSRAQGNAPFVIDSVGPASALIQDLEAAGVPLIVLTTSEVRQACGMFYDLVMSQQMHHHGQSTLALAVSMLRKRKLQDGFAWNRANNQSDITPAVAANWAVYGLAKSKVDRIRAEARVSNVMYGFN